jgi:hypothetical protein
MQNFKLTETQRKKIARAQKMKSSVILRLNKGQKHPGGTPLLLTEHQKATLNDGYSHDIKLPYKKIKIGGIIPILPILGGVGALTGIITSIVNAVKNSRKSNALIDAARAAEELAKQRLVNEQKTGSGLKYKFSN